MAFNDAKKYADKLRLKGPQLYNQGDLTARREQCWSPWCNVFVEDMGDSNRCKTDDCERRLRAEAQERGIMFKVGNAWFGNIDSLLVDPDTIQQTIHTQEILRRRGIDQEPVPMCACGKGAKAPHKEVCIQCYKAANLALHYERKRNPRKQQRQRKGSTGMNRIQGLEALRDKLK